MPETKTNQSLVHLLRTLSNIRSIIKSHFKNDKPKEKTYLAPYRFSRESAHEIIYTVKEYKPLPKKNMMDIIEEISEPIPVFPYPYKIGSLGDVIVMNCNKPSSGNVRDAPSLRQKAITEFFNHKKSREKRREKVIEVLNKGRTNVT